MAENGVFENSNDNHDGGFDDQNCKQEATGAWNYFMFGASGSVSYGLRHNAEERPPIGFSLIRPSFLFRSMALLYSTYGQLQPRWQSFSNTDRSVAAAGNHPVLCQICSPVGLSV